MKPTRAAWLFAAALGWLVLRGLLVHSQPWLRTEHAAREGGLFLVLPLLSVLAGLAVPLFFAALLRHHSFDGQPVLRAMTVATLVSSSMSFCLVLVSFADIVRGVEPTGGIVATSAPWLFQSVPALFVVTLVGFLWAFATQADCPPELRRAAAVAAVGALVPVLLITAWIVHSRVPGALEWFPGFGRSLIAKGIGVASAGALFWFLESFATGYGRDPAE